MIYSAELKQGLCTDHKNMINITKLAMENLKRLQEEYDCIGQGLRFGLTNKGCSGYKYIIEFEESKKEGDIIYNIVYNIENEDYGIDVFVSSEHIDKLKNSTIGWEETLMTSGFDISNPQAEMACGCGESVNFNE